MRLPVSIVIVFGLFAVISAVEVSPAQAKPTVLCSANEDPCPEEKRGGELYGWGGPESSIPTRLDLVASSGTISCESGKLVFRPLETQGEPLKGEAFLGFHVCTLSGEKCEVEGSLNRSATVEATGGGSGGLTVVKPWVEVDCLGLMKCKYEAGSMQASVTAGEVVGLKAKATLPRVQGFFCATEVTYEGEFEDVLSPTYLTHP